MGLQYNTNTVSGVLPVILSDLIGYAPEVGSRGGHRVKELINTQINIKKPWKREVLTPGRSPNVFAQIAETCWVLSGRNDIEWLTPYLPRAVDFSDDGKTWRSGYGPRIRSWDGGDQLEYVIDTLRNDALSRQAVIAIWDPNVDNLPGKDRACNTQLQFLNRDGQLHLTVTVRSNDVMWGWSGINAFEWSVLQEIVAATLRISIGTLTFNIGSLHIYDRHWEKAARISGPPWDDLESDLEKRGYRRLRIDPDDQPFDLEDMDLWLDRFFEWEERCRKNDVSIKELSYSDPNSLFVAWMAAIAYYWTREQKWLDYISGTALAAAVHGTPKKLYPEPVKPSQGVRVYTSNPAPLSESDRAFLDFVNRLHTDKHTSYGDSWKKRGEKVSILANIARKVDRLNVEDRFESKADTWIDLWVYLAKYLCWLYERDQGPEEVARVLHGALNKAVQDDIEFDDPEGSVTADLNVYIDQVENFTLRKKQDFIWRMLDYVTIPARGAWLADDQYRGADVD